MIGILLLLGISVVNALTIYKITTRRDINIRIFRQLLVAKLLELSENTKNPCLRWNQHKIPEEALDAHANYIMRIKDDEWTEQRHKRI